MGAMASGAAVIRYDGSRGVVWRIKWRDADGQQVQETLGAAADGWTKRRAEAELRARLTDVQREGRRRAQPLTFEVFAREWLETYPAASGLKRSTTQGYRGILERHLIPAFGAMKLDAISVSHVERYVALKRGAAYGPRTVNLHLNLLHKLFATALRRQLVRTNVVSAVERPRAPRRRWTILSPEEVRAVEAAFEMLIAEAADEEQVWREQAKIVLLVSVGLGLRRGEILGLRWRDVALADPDGARLRVRETLVRGQTDTPKSERGERTLALGRRLAEELFQHRARTAYAGEDEYVFVSPTKGSPFDAVRYTTTLRAALARAGIERPMRPFHDMRHTSLTNAAAAGTPPAALQARAGHASYGTTQLYVDLAGETFRDEAERLERRLWGEPVQKTGTNSRSR
jgi:integrase